MVKNRKGTSGVEGGKGTCYQWKEKGQSSKGDQCCFRHESNDRAQKPDHNAATPSKPSLSRGRSVSKKRRIRGKNNHGATLRQPCRLFEGYLHAIVLWMLASSRVSILQNRNGLQKPWKSVCSRIIRLMNNQTKSQRKATVPKCDDKNAVAIGKIVPQSGCVSQDSEAHSVYATSSKYPEKDRTIALKNTSQTSSSAKSVPTLWNLRTGPMKWLKDCSDAPKARHGTLPETYASSKRTTKLHSIRSRKSWVLSAASTKELEERVCGGFWR